MSNYTTQTAALKATTVDTRLLDAKQIDTKKLFIDGELFDPSQIKESPNQIILMLAILITDESKVFGFMNEDGEPIIRGDFENNKVQFDLFELLTILYPDRNATNEILPCLNLLGSNFSIIHYIISDGNMESISIEPCILDLHCQESFSDNVTLATIKLGEEDDKLEELFGGYSINIPPYEVGTMFYMSIPYATPPSQSSTFSLRQPQVSPLSLEQAQQVFTHLRQQMLDKSAE